MSGGSKWLQESRLDKEAINEIIKDPRGSKWLQECPLDIEIINEIVKDWQVPSGCRKAGWIMK